MVSMMVDSHLQSRFKETSETVNLVDEVGAVVRIALTPDEYERMLYRSARPPITDEELASYAHEKGTGSLQDFWKQIGAK